MAAGNSVANYNVTFSRSTASKKTSLPSAPVGYCSRSHKKYLQNLKKLFALYVSNKLRNLCDHRIVVIETDKDAVI